MEIERKMTRLAAVVTKCTIAVIMIVSVYYDILDDEALILAVFCAAFAIGSRFLAGLADNKISVFIQTAIGMGILGVIIYFVLLFGKGSRSVYVCLLAGAILIGRERLKKECCKLVKSIREQRFSPMFFCVTGLIFLIYVLYASAPIDKYDTLTKHLPLAMYAAKTGEWNTNIMESLVYGECMLLQYTYSAVFVAFGAYKALTIFNVCLFFLVGLALKWFCDFLNGKTVRLSILLVILFSTPIFFEFSTCFYVEILPIFFLAAIILCTIDDGHMRMLEKLPYAAWLAGCAVFCKLTIAYSVFVVGLWCIMLSLRDWRKADRRPGLLGVFAKCSACFVSPFATSVLYNWYWIGNPVFPFFNGLFKSPYFPKENFTDPFQNPLSLSLSSLVDMVFHTSQNIEMRDLGLGFFLLLIWIVPVAALLKKNKRLMIWLLLALAAFQISCFFTYNIRYSLSILMVLGAIIATAASELLEMIPYKKLQTGVCAIVLCTLVVPNVMYISNAYDLAHRVLPDSAITKADNRSLLKEVPSDKCVFSLNDPFKGEFDGYYNAYMWHNQYNVSRIENGEISLRDYISSFDYVLYQKNLYASEQVTEYLNTDAKEQLKPVKESDTHILYQVIGDSPEVLMEDDYLEPLASTVDKPVFIPFVVETGTEYSVEQDIENTGTEKQLMRFQINWLDEQGHMIDTSIELYDLMPGRSVAQKQGFTPPDGATQGLLYLSPHDTRQVLVHGYKLFGTSGRNDIKEQAALFYSRSMLEDTTV